MARRLVKRAVKAGEVKTAPSKYRSNYAPVWIGDVRDKRIIVVNADFKRGESAKRYAEMVAFVRQGKGKATFGDVLANTSYHMGDVRWDILRGDIQIADAPQVELHRAMLTEGELSHRVIQVRSRSISVRELCIERHGSRCAVCKLDFGERFGEMFVGLIEVHHKKPIALLDGGTDIDPESDCVPLCPNCHSMAHFGLPPGECRPLDQLQDLFAGSEYTVEP